VLRGWNGSGTIFFNWCNLRWEFCQNREISLRNYCEVNRAAVKEMNRQVGDLRLDENGLAYRGLLIRHRVLPADVAGTETVLAFIAREISTGTYLNVMGQYYPYYRASERPELAGPITAAEYGGALDIARRLGLTRPDRPLRTGRRI
jgi:putative pyruvate formate lyase activating enzyme